MTPRKPVVPLPEWVIELVAAIEKSKQCAVPINGTALLALVPEHVRQTARRWAS